MVENLAFGERRLGMRATVADSEYLVADAEHGNAIVTQGDTDATIAGQGVDRADLDPHATRPSSCAATNRAPRRIPALQTFDRQPVDHLLEEPSDQSLRSFPVQPPAHQVIEVIDSAGPPMRRGRKSRRCRGSRGWAPMALAFSRARGLRLVSKVDVRAASFSIGGGR